MRWFHLSDHSMLDERIFGSAIAEATLSNIDMVFSRFHKVMRYSLWDNVNII